MTKNFKTPFILNLTSLESGATKQNCLYKEILASDDVGIMIVDVRMGKTKDLSDRCRKKNRCIISETMIYFQDFLARYYIRCVE